MKKITKLFFEVMNITKQIEVGLLSKIKFHTIVFFNLENRAKYRQV